MKNYTQEQREDFVVIRDLYKKSHGSSYARRIAWGIAINGFPF